MTDHAIVTTTAAEVRPGVRIREIEGVRLNPPVLVEAAELVHEFDAPSIRMTVWHDAGWMFGIDIEPDARIEVVAPEGSVPPAAEPRDPDLVRVHGTWKRRGEVGWAPEGYPLNVN